MSKIRKIKEAWDGNVPIFQNKVSKILSSGDERVSASVNPFLDKNGSVFNPYINYQKILNSGNITDSAKKYIQQATGLTPTIGIDEVPTQSVRITQSKSNLPKSNSGIVNAAQKYIGTPYVWGGESMSEGGMDCSGFIYNALKDAGYNIGRKTAQGYRGYGTVVNKSDMQPGDLVFYGTEGEASHVGVYIGNGQMIHSAGGSKNTKSNPGKGVSIVNVDHRSDFLEARRY